MLFAQIFGKILQKDTLAHRWGFDTQMSALRARAKRCEKAWKPHIELCHQVLEQSLQKQLQLQQKQKLNSVLVLGSGLLKETPISILQKYSEKIYLADLFHSTEAKLAAKQFPNQVFLSELDATALFSSLRRGFEFAEIEKNMNLLSAQMVTTYWPECDFVISANILSQLPIILVERMKGQAEEKEKVRLRVRQQHIDFLKSYKSDALLFSDFVVQYFSADNILESEADFQLNMDGFTKIAEWDWNIAPIPEYDKKTSVNLKVRAFELLK